MIATARAIFTLAVVGLATPPMMLLQAFLLGLRLPGSRWLPVIYHRFVCRVMGVRIKVIGTPSPQRPLLVVSNHISWLDISVISATAPVSFIAKSEVATWHVIGWLARLQRSVFVTRERRTQTARTANHIAGRLSDGDCMVLFAEGTTGDGNRLRPFRSALVGAAEALAAPDEVVMLQPMAIAYTRINGLPLGYQHRPLVAWCGDLDLGPHLWALLKAGPVDVTVAYGEPHVIDHETGRKQATAEAERAVTGLFLTAMHAHPAQTSLTPVTSEDEQAPQT